MYTRQKGKYVHAYTGYVFKCLEIPTPAMKLNILIHPCVQFSPFKLKSTASFCFTNRAANTELVWAAHSQSTKHSPDAEPRLATFRWYLTHSPCKPSADISISFPPRSILNHIQFPCFPEDLHPPGTSPHHLWITSPVAFGDWNQKNFYTWKLVSFLHPLCPTRHCYQHDTLMRPRYALCFSALPYAQNWEKCKRCTQKRSFRCFSNLNWAKCRHKIFKWQS